MIKVKSAAALMTSTKRLVKKVRSILIKSSQSKSRAMRVTSLMSIKISNEIERFVSVK